MTRDFASKSTLDRMLPALMDGALALADEARFWKLLEADGDARTYYHDFVELHSILHSLHASPDELGMLSAFAYSESRDEPTDGAPAKSPLLGFLGDIWETGISGASSMLQLVLAAIMVTSVSLLAIVAIWVAPNYQGGVSEQPAPPSLPFVARLTQAVDCRWADAEAAPKVGSFLLPGRALQLEEGLAEITFQCGAVVILEAPAVLLPKADYSAALQLGRLTAEVPPAAIGFAIETPRVRVVDLGTRFGVEVDDRHNAEVHVLQGQVAGTWLDQQQDRAEIVRLTRGNAARFDVRQRKVLRRPANPGRFVREIPKVTPRVQFYTDETAWRAAVGRVEMLRTRAGDLAMAEEVGGPVVPGQVLGPVLNFLAGVTGLARGFRVRMLEPGSGADHGFVFNDRAEIVNTNNSEKYSSDAFLDALSVGKIDQFEDDDWQIEITSGPKLYALAVDLCDNAAGAAKRGESLSVYGAGERRLATFKEIPGGATETVSFLGVVSNIPITKIVFDEDPFDDDTAIANFRFAETRERH